MLHPSPDEAVLLSDVFPHAVWTADATGHTVWGNSVWQAFASSHHTAEQVDLMTLLHPEAQRTLASKLAQRAPFETELQFGIMENEARWFRVAGQLQTSGSHSSPMWLFTAVNIDDLVQERQQRDKLQSMMDASPSCIKVLDLDSRLVSMNEGGMVTMEIDDFDICRNLLWLDFWDGRTRERVEDALERARQGERTSIEAARTTFKGTPKWWEITMAPLYDQQGRVHQLSVVSRDITAAKAAQEAISALDAFVAFSKVSSTTTDVLVLARHAVNVLQATLGEVSVVYFTLEDDLWKGQVWSDDLAPDIAAVLSAGIPVTAPSYAQAMETQQPVFVAGWNAEIQGVARTDEYGAAAFYPCVAEDRPLGLLTMGTRRTGELSERERAVFRSVGRSLTLALERAGVAQRVIDQHAELEARTRALVGFATLTHDLTLHTEPNALLHRSMDLVLSLLPEGYALFFQQRGARWEAAALVGNVRSHELRTAIEGGFPVGRTPSLDLPCETKEPWFQDNYDRGRDMDASLVQHLHTVATLPVIVNGKVHGIFNVALFEPRSWSAADRAVLTTTVHSLGLALESAQGVVHLSEERRKLEAANEELEAFAYSVSHDLRTPVRHIISFTSLLHRHLTGQMDTKATQYLTVIEDAAQRMNTLIDAMLDLSRTSRLPLRVTLVDLGSLVDRARQDLQPDLMGREVCWEIKSLPLVMGDADTLHQVVENLLSNALKYSRSRAVAVIEIWAEEREREWAVFVRDNGAGFDPRYSDKLFSVFQRLHRHDEFEGVGVGLANVRRIIHRHGGQVTASGSPGDGATFGFTLPKH